MYCFSLFSDNARFCEVKEHKGFLKYVCDEEVFKCAYSDTYFEYHRQTYETPYIALCQNDPHFYQMCDLEFAGERDWSITNNELLCGSYLCDDEIYGLVSSFFLALNGVQCTETCRNTDLNKRGCKDEGEEQVTLPSGYYKVAPSQICNGVCDTFLCEDEAVCNGYTYGMYCRRRGNPNDYVPPLDICNILRDCDEGDDEADCEVTEDRETSCRHNVTGRLVPVHDYTRCTILSNFFMNYCKVEDTVLYQTNCTNPEKVALRCKINGYMSSVSKYIICNDDEVSACDDQLDSQCFKTKVCKTHKHLMCDEKTNCTDGADETHNICRSMTKQTCQRRVGEKSELPIPTSWIRDGMRDCENGIDETDNLPTCGKEKTLRYF